MRWLFVVVGLLSLPPAAVACPGEAPRRSPLSGLYTFTWENDIVGGSDDNYTNGVRYSYLSTPLPAESPHARLARRVLRADCEDAVLLGLAWGQSMYTPTDTAAVDPPADEHPYAGWLYGEYALTVVSPAAAGRPRTFRSLAALVGVVGPAAQGERVQNTFHEWIDNPPSLGWDAQLANEPGLLLAYDQRWQYTRAAPFFLSALQLDVLAGGGAALGNVLSQASAGLVARLGTSLDASDLPPRVRPGTAGTGLLGHPGEWLHASLFAGIEGRATLRNIFLDGNTFRESARVERVPVGTDVVTGVALRVWRAQVSLSFVTRSPEFTTQPAPHRFGSLGLSWRW